MGTILPLVYVGLSVLLALVGVPLMLGKVPPNRVYGFRTAKTLSDPAIWYPANKTAGRNLLIAGVCSALLSIGVVKVSSLVEPNTVPWLCVAALGLPLLLAVAHSFAFLSRL